MRVPTHLRVPSDVARRARSGPLAARGLTASVGIHIEGEEIHLVGLAHRHGRDVTLAGLRTVPIPAGGIDSPGFAERLRAALHGFGADASTRLWMVWPSEESNVRALRIPPVPRPQIPNTVAWLFKSETAFDDEETVFDFEVDGEVREPGGTKLGVTAYVVPRREAEKLQALFQSIDFSLTGITLPFFALRNVVRRAAPGGSEEPQVLVRVAGAWSQIAVFVKGVCVVTRTIMSGIHGLIESIVQNSNGRMEPDAARAALRSAAAGNHETAGGGADLFPMIRPSLQRLVGQIERTLESHFSSPERGRGEHARRILVAGPLGSWQAVTDFLQAELGAPAQVLDPAAALGGADRWPSLSEVGRVPYAEATGAALADCIATPNVLYTRRAKEQAAAARRGHLAGAGLLLAVLAVASGALLWQRDILRERQGRVNRLQAQLASFQPQLEEQQVMKAAEAVMAQRRAVKRLSREYTGLAVMSELSALTPPNISLTSINLMLGPIPRAEKTENPKKRGGRPPQPNRVLDLNGIVRGERQLLEAYLAQYVLRMEGASLFRQASVRGSDVLSAGEEKLLSFRLRVELADGKEEKKEAAPEPIGAESETGQSGG